MSDTPDRSGWLHFAAREVPPFAVPVPESELRVGGIYFAVHYCDTVTLVPELEALAFVGKDVYPDDEGPGYYFQDASSYLSGVPYDNTGENEPLRILMRPGQVRVMEYERALDVLLHCSVLRQRKGSSG